MTREEAIEVLEVHKAHWERLLDNGICDVLEGGNTIQALKVAIRALKNEQTDGDLISRQAVLKCFNIRELKFKDKEDAELMKHYLELAFDDLAKLPSAEKNNYKSRKNNYKSGVKQ